MLHHIEESGSENHSSRLSDDLYRQVLDSIVVTCVDIALVSEDDEVLMGQRTDEPANGCWWILGGRIVWGKSPTQMAQAIVKREIGVDISDLDQFVDLGLSISYVWRTRSQGPEGHGCHMVGLYYMVRISDEIKAAVSLSAKTGFSGFRWVPLSEMRDDASLHEGMQKVADSVQEFLF